MRELAGVLIGAALCLAASPYLARLSLDVPDDASWAVLAPRGGRAAASGRRMAVTAAVALVLGALAAAGAGWSALLPALLALALCATPLVVIDVERHRLPDRLVLVAAGAAAVLLALAALLRGDWWPYLRAAEAAAAVFAALFVLALISPASFGFGDVKLGAVLGAYLGWFGWACVFYGIAAGFVLGSAVALVLLATRRASMRTALAFGPMLVLGTLLVLLTRA